MKLSRLLLFVFIFVLTVQCYAKKHGYCKFFRLTDTDPNRTILTVPHGQHFVLRKIYTAGSARWTFTANGDFSFETQGTNEYDFPVNCAVANPDETLEISWMSGSYVDIIIMGHFIPSHDCPEADLDGDCDVDFDDFALFASEWLTSGE